MRIHLRFGRLFGVRKTGILHTALGKDYFCPRILFLYHFNCLKMISGIPVYGSTFDIFGCFFILYTGAETLKQNFFVVVPHENIHIRKTCFFQCFPKVISYKLSFFFCGIHTGIPGLDSRRLILYGQCPDINSFGTIGLDKFNKIGGPGGVIFFL